MQEMVRRGVGSASVSVAAFAARAILEPDDLPVLTDLAAIRGALEGRGGVKEIPRDERWQLRSRILLADNRIGALIKAGDLKLAPAELDDLNRHRSRLRALTDYAPFWVLAIVALSLGLGTMIGWKRIVVTVGEKIGKQHLTYTQGAAAELVAMTTI